MQTLFLGKDNKALGTVDKSEKELQQFICDNWQALFPAYTFVASEFHLKGCGSPDNRFDILAYNPATNKLIIFELKKDFNKLAVLQALNYSYAVRDKFDDVYVKATREHNVALPDKAEIKKEVEIALIAKAFSREQFSQALEAKESVMLIRHNWFENDILLLDYVYNAPADKPTGYASMNWDELVDVIKNPEHKAFFQTNSPDTKENIDKLRQFVNHEWGHNVGRCRAYLKWLDIHEAGLEKPALQ